MEQYSLQSHREYQQISQAMAYLLEHQQHQPELAELSATLGFSESHMQRLFSRWVGVSPKRFLQYLTLQRAQQQLAESNSVLELAYDLGLSSAGRLYDLFVNIAAVTPGEAKSLGAGIQIYYGWGLTPFGWAFVASTTRGICQLSFCETEDDSAPLDELNKAWPKAQCCLDETLSQQLLSQVFDGGNSQQPLSLWLKGTNFQLQVWQALLKLPFGSLCSYQFLAEQVSSSNATRAVASAVAKNPIAFVIPCHRVIRSSGALGGYRWGLERKQLMMGREAVFSERALNDRAS
ncbi:MULTISPECIES: methylated-DNA--[protein]-cysteine S-methyltransferase [unclassified Agarivorans]|uniref:methylated-DNA--[protein]-cysteine S-methyltransferase n=1 Tax=unclassified Agarivorans TaxID=2636026 RepID=UPI0026E480AE|nr:MULTISPECIES: methylated-DNA--[protein]-cysteine S-methyltransferase [unclassified Agarivorans]MDO6687295.1 methylated-DNA--[protein]-cysteine S-methyltransferase [Agarivorans sp. 3_MG-2023]MDO6716953.1 methylated-DNA--[protein]-cysteine S-methyltransferase [Agarivorans sp. 2_MG-2023]